MARSAATQILKRHGATAFNTNALVIDELGYLPVSRQARNALLQVINRFDEYRSLIHHAKSEEQKRGVRFTYGRASLARCEDLAPVGEN